MTPSDQSAFTAAFGTLASVLGFGEELRREPGIGLAYWLDLQPFPLDVVRAGLRACGTGYSGMRNRPRPSEVRQFVERAAADLRQLHGQTSHLACETCDSTGWHVHYCPGVDAANLLTVPNVHSDPTRRCQRPHRHPAHTYAVRCHCRQERAS